MVKIDTFREIERRPYVICDGVSVPIDWTVEELREALGARKLKFHSEQEILYAFGDALRIRQSLEQGVARLRKEASDLSQRIKRLSTQIDKKTKDT